MERIGLLPLGDMEGTSYFNIVPNSVSKLFCPQGMRNIIGMIPGTDPPHTDEYVIFSAHYNGPNNENPQTKTTRRNQDTTNTFDDALAVAFGLALAEEMMLKSSPKRSVIFLFDDVEEGWKNVLTPPHPYTYEGYIYYALEMSTYWCYGDDPRTYYDAVMSGIPGFEGYLLKGIGNFNTDVQVGFGSWLRDPTVDISKVKLIFNIDPLGIPLGVSPDNLVLAVLNGETSTSVSSEGSHVSLNDIIDQALPDSAVSYAKFPRAAIVQNTNNAEALTEPTTLYRYLCEAGNNCRDDGGIPNVSYVAVLLSFLFVKCLLFYIISACAKVWLAAMSFQKYHGGVLIDSIKQLFQKLSAGGLYHDKNLPDTAYFSVDKADAGNFEAEALNALTTSLYAFINNLFAREELSTLTFNQDNPPDETYQYTADDLANLINSMVLLSKRIDVIAPELEFYKQAQAFVISQLNNLEEVSSEIPSFQAAMKELAPVCAALHLSLDTFNRHYTKKEAFLDQTVAGYVVAEPVLKQLSAPSTSPSNSFAPSAKTGKSPAPSLSESEVPSWAPSKSSEPTPLAPNTKVDKIEMFD